MTGGQEKNFSTLGPKLRENRAYNIMETKHFKYALIWMIIKGASSLRQLCPRLCCWDDPTFGFFEKVDKLTEYLRYLVFLLFRIQRDLGWINLCLLRLLRVLALFQNLTDYGDCVHSREDGHYASCQGWVHHDIHLHASCVPGDQDQLKEYIGLWYVDMWRGRRRDKARTAYSAINFTLHYRTFSEVVWKIYRGTLWSSGGIYWQHTAHTNTSRQSFNMKNLFYLSLANESLGWSWWTGGRDCR